MASSQFIPSPPLPQCSHYDSQPGVIVPPSSNSNLAIPSQNPAPSNSPCQDCAIHQTILQSMAFSMQCTDDYATCQHLHASASCQSCYYNFQLQQQRAAMGQGQHFHHAYQTQCGHSNFGSYNQRNNTQHLVHTPSHSNVPYQDWSQAGSLNGSQDFLPPPPEVASNRIPSTIYSPYSPNTSVGVLSVPSPTAPGIPHSTQGYHLPSPDVIPHVNNAIGTLRTPARGELSLGREEVVLMPGQERRGSQNSGIDSLSGISNIKLEDGEIKQEEKDEGPTTTHKKKLQKTSSDRKRNRDGEKKGSEARKRQPEDLCQVCGDRASGYHYNALTCEGCKGFFRRSITNKASYKQGCKHGGTCQMDTYTRRKCPFCRLKKCKEVGMLEECLLTEIQCRSKRKRRNQRQQQAEDVRVDETSPSTNATSPAQSSVASSPSASDGSQNGEGGVSLVMTDEETDLLETVKHAFSRYNINEDIVKRWEMYINNESKTSCRLSDITTVHVQVLVEYAKSIPGFAILEPEDQIALLKGCVFEAMLLRNSCGYLHLRREINKSAILDELGIPAETLDALLDFFNCIGKLGMDKVEYALLIAIVIFNSDYPFVKNKSNVEEYQDLYLSTLAKYSLTREPVRPSIFARMLAMLTEIRSLSHFNSEVVTSWKKRGALTPLLCEIWDLD